MADSQPAHAHNPTANWIKWCGSEIKNQTLFKYQTKMSNNKKKKKTSPSVYIKYYGFLSLAFAIILLLLLLRTPYSVVHIVLHQFLLTCVGLLFSSVLRLPLPLLLLLLLLIMMVVVKQAFIRTSYKCSCAHVIVVIFLLFCSFALANMEIKCDSVACHSKKE